MKTEMWTRKRQSVLYRPVLIEGKSPLCYVPFVKRNTRSQLLPQNHSKLMPFIQYCTPGTTQRVSVCTHHFLPVRNWFPLVITVHDDDMPEIMLLQCWAQVIGDECALLLGWIPTTVDMEVFVVPISRFILRGHAPNVDALLPVGLQNSVIRIAVKMFLLSVHIIRNNGT